MHECSAQGDSSWVTAGQYMAIYTVKDDGQHDKKAKKRPWNLEYIKVVLPVKVLHSRDIGEML
jgi:hypothetical protein